MTDKQSITAHALASRVLMSFSVDETMLPWLVKLSTSFKGPPFSAEMSPLWLKHIVWFFVCVDMEAYATRCAF